MAGTKRASPGAEEEKNPLDVKITDELHEKLQAARVDMTRVELALGSLRVLIQSVNGTDGGASPRDFVLAVEMYRTPCAEEACSCV